ncbi:hypothetical protein [Cyclobacterium xiamenense]|uniref:hypothetical protein n=1 Tax=Cyclobacterium xiamenense TaxID=1297121 RepID=UPI0035CFE6BD
MYQRIFSGLFFLMSLATASAQNDSSKWSQLDSTSRYELGLNTYFAFDQLMDQHQRTPLELMLRKKIHEQNRIRLRVFGMVSRYKKIEAEFTNIDGWSTIGLALGYEWIKPLARRWEGYYGLELEGSREHSRSFFEQPDLDPETNYLENTDKYERGIRFSLSPLAGLRFRLTSRLLLSTEFRLSGYMGEQQYTEHMAIRTNEEGSQNQIQSSEGYTVKLNGLRFQPYTGIFLNYRF